MVISLAISALFAFNGGDAADFAGRYSAATHSSVVVAAFGPVPPMDIDLPSVPDNAHLGTAAAYVAAKLDAVYKILPLSNYPCQIFTPRTLPPWFVHWSDDGFNSYQLTFPASQNQGLIRDDGVWRAESAAGTFQSVDNLRRQKFAKPVEVHWLLRHYNMAVHASFPTEKDYLNATAIAIGGKLRATGDVYRIDLDPITFRRQLIAYWQERRASQTEPYDLAYSDFRVAALRAMSDAQILHAMASEQSYISFSAEDGTALGRAARAVVEAFLYQGSDPGSRDRKINEVNRSTLALGDLSRPLDVLFTSHGGIKLEVWAAQGDGGVVELP